ncbi:TetR family transcriptional regulator [Mycobacterium sp. 21AC1]|uniref:TetR/AcrR family transcriptional regulator n=1 Tax=[Mycobacterium] appelbergii TaxID=2939269 RepID=UPI002938E265|nr:TetR family transcriptional regulator [Mycobacterium sp. 21AC1]MDV3126729.1 TetR family transcriptional regulator [Mycobacterium sp. 21AC1]
MAFTPRSATTRAAILAAARKLLSEQGYEAMTIRAVAAEVGIDPSMVMRYYGNKAGLLSAAVDLDLHFDQVSPPPRKQLGEALARHFLSRWEGELSDDATTLLLRAAATNPFAAERMREIFDTQVTAFVRAFAGDDASVPRRAGLAASQLLGLALTRYIIGIRPITEMSVDELVADIAPVLQYYLTGDLGAADSRAVRKARSPGRR